MDLNQYPKDVQTIIQRHVDDHHTLLHVKHDDALSMYKLYFKARTCYAMITYYLYGRKISTDVISLEDFNVFCGAEEVTK